MEMHTSDDVADNVTSRSTYYSAFVSVVGRFAPLSATEFLAVVAILLGSILIHEVYIRTMLKKFLNGKLYNPSHETPPSDVDGNEEACNVPGPWLNVPLLGYLPFLGSKPYKTMLKLAERYGNVYQIRLGSHPAIVLNGYETIREAMTRRGEDLAGRPDFPSFQSFCRGYSMTFASYDNVWSLHRRLGTRAMAAFTNNTKFPIDSLIRRQAQFLAERLLQDASCCNSPVDPYYAIETAVIRILFRVCYGETRDVTSSGDDEYARMIAKLHGFRAVIQQVQGADVLPWTEPLVRSKIGQYRRCLEEFDDLSLNKIDELTADGVHKYGDADCLVRALEDASRDCEAAGEGKVDRRRLMAIVQDVIGAGTDTAVFMIHWMIQYAAKFPDVQERIRDEIRRVVGTDGTVNGSDRQRMPYTEAVVWESLRFSCISASTIPHAALRDTKIAGFFVPKDTLVLLNLYSVGWDPAVWGDPERFRPERYLIPDGTAVDREAVRRSLLFGVGKRRCFGQQLARTEMFIFLVSLLQRCTFVEDPKHPLTLEGQFSFTNKANDYVVHVRPVH